MNEHEGLWACCIFAAIASFAAIMLAMGPCVQQEKVESKVEHLERRLDNLRDR